MGTSYAGGQLQKKTNDFKDWPIRDKQADECLQASMTPVGMEVEGHTRWPDLVFNHFLQKSDQPGWNRERQRAFLLQWEEWALDERFLEEKEMEPPTFSEFFDARTLLKTNAAPAPTRCPPVSWLASAMMCCTNFSWAQRSSSRI